MPSELCELGLPLDKHERLLIAMTCRQLIIKYSHYIGFDNAERVAELFAEDGVWEFPVLPAQRRQCSALAQALQRDGYSIYRQSRSQVSHPPPNGLVHFIRRGLS